MNKTLTGAVEWTAIETRAGGWEVRHSAGRSFTEEEGRVVVDALNALRRVRVRVLRDVMVAGQAVAPGTVLDLPLREAQQLLSSAGTEIVV